MDVLFIHQNFPAQFVHLANALRKRRDIRIGVVTDLANEQPDQFPTARYRWDARKAGAPDRVARPYAVSAARGRMVARAMESIQQRGFQPKVVVGHIGWGETLFVKDVFPEARLVTHAEFFYSPTGADVGFDPEFKGVETLDQRIQLRAKNAALVAAMNETDIAVAPTPWQGSRFPQEWQSKIRIAHEGVDTDAIAPDPRASFRVPGSGLELTAKDEIVTFVNRNLEPYRGYHIFMRALPRIMTERPNAHAVIVGGSSVSYGPAAPEGDSWMEIFKREVADRLPADRVHFVSRIPFPNLLSLFQITSAHVYLTYPFVLSWSMLQAMAAGAPVIASRTAPVLDVIEDGVNGVLVDFFDAAELAERVIEALDKPERLRAMRAAGRRSIVETFDLKRVCLPRWVDLVLRG
jgi:glycosyltransferase involved in cell wall biosynthesis